MKADWLHVAVGELLLDVHEIAGPDTNSRIGRYLDVVGLAPDDETPWCSAFVNWCLREVGETGTRRPNARSFLSWGLPSEALPGAVTVLWRGSPGGWQGHVGFLLGSTPNSVYLLGGNQSDSVSVAAFPIDRVLGYRVPKE